MNSRINIFQGVHFPKSEHLCGKKSIENLFCKGKRVSSYPLLAVFQECSRPAMPGSIPFKLGISVPGSFWKRAVDRNRIKRLIRESYRFRKSDCISSFARSGKHGKLFLIYKAREHVSSADISTAIERILSQITISPAS